MAFRQLPIATMKYNFGLLLVFHWMIYNIHVNCAVQGRCDLITVKKTACHMSDKLARLVDSRFYKKFVDIDGFQILGSDHLDDSTLATYGHLIKLVMDHLRWDVKDAILRQNMRMAVMSRYETFCNAPEINNGNLATGKPCYQSTIQGVTYRRLMLVAERDGLSYCTGYHNSSKAGRVAIHEFTHAINKGIDSELGYLKAGLDSAYAYALETKLLDGLKDKSRYHYFTWGFMTYINANECDQSKTALRDRLCTKDQLYQYDPTLYRLIESVVQDFNWSYKCSDKCTKDQITVLNCD